MITISRFEQVVTTDWVVLRKSQFCLDRNHIIRGGAGITQGMCWEVTSDKGALLRVMVSLDGLQWYEGEPGVTIEVEASTGHLIPLGHDWHCFRYLALSAKLPQGLEGPSRVFVSGWGQ